MSRGEIRKALRELKELYEEGLLEEGEYQQERQALMERWRRMTPGAQGSQRAQGAADAFMTGGGASPGPAVGAAGRVLMGRYRLERLLGEGGMGRVYYAQDLELDEGCAVKMIHPHLAQVEDIRRRFVQEVKLTRRLMHPGIVRTHALQREREGGELFITMEFIEGQTLESALAQRKGQVPPMALEQTLEVAEALAQVLEYAHGQGVIHRDLKPGNVMLLEDGQIKLMDFGIAKALSGTHATKHTGFVGTVYYMAPEQLRGGEVTAAADVFSLGVMLYELLTGQVPMGHVGPPSRYLGSLPTGVDAVVLKAMAGQVGERYAHASEVTTALRQALAGGGRASRGAREEQRRGPELHTPSRARSSGPDRQAGESLAVEALPDPRMLWCPPGRFLMGSPDSDGDAYDDEKPQYEVTLTRGFWLGQTPVTQAQFEAIMGYNPARFQGGGRHPVEQVSWHEAAAFCNALSRKLGLPEVYDEDGSGKEIQCRLKAAYAGSEGRDYYAAGGFRLPTEAEWECACRAGSNAPRYGEVGEIAWYDENAGGTTHPVGQMQANAWGFYDMLGHVYEWCWDWHGKYQQNASVDPLGPSTGSFRVLRGGSWYSYARVVRAAYRDWWGPRDRNNNVGFRLVRSGG